MFSKILVANRGEIAVRVIRAARELNIKTVAIYTKYDIVALHVILADEAYKVDDYLNASSILNVAEKAKVDAIHPGYGFLSENPEFASLVEKNGFTFIGPSPKAMKLAGNKVEARKIALKAEIPVIPGTIEPVRDLEKAKKAAEELGYPVLLKAVGGGGGIGMRIARNEEELENYLNLSRMEAGRSFKTSDIYIEKYLSKPRHIEVQILADNYGNIIHLFERECSIQRRFQKLIEEAPSKALMWDERLAITRDAVKFIEEAKYTNAGTVEFLYKDGKYYFLEVNARLQVEHGITEMVTGVDIVKAQIRIAADEPLNISQGQISIRGWAIEVRINAEDPLNDFTPSPGKIVKYHEPGGLGVRVDSGVYEGYTVPPMYNPLIAKLIVWGEDRLEAIFRLRRALLEYIIEGVKTTIPLYKEIINDKDFIEGNIHTAYLQEKLPKFIEKLATDERKRIVAAAIANEELNKHPISVQQHDTHSKLRNINRLWKNILLPGHYMRTLLYRKRNISRFKR